MAHNLVTGLRPRAENQVEHARGQTRFGENLRDANGRRGRVRRGLEDDRVARDERGRELPDGDRDGEVPRGYDCDDAVRLSQGVCEVRRKLGRNRLAVHAPRLARAELRDVYRALQLAARLPDGLALLARE